MNAEYLKTRTPAKSDSFVWVPTGHVGGIPSGIVGYWHGEINHKGKALVEFPEGTVSVDRSAIYEATDAEVDEMLGDNERWAAIHAEASTTLTERESQNSK